MSVLVSVRLALTDKTNDFSDEFDKPEYQDERIFIDVLCVPQTNVGDVVKTTKSTYRGCWLVVFVDGNYLTRAWCALEIAVGMSTGSRLTVIGSCDMIQDKNFYDKLAATIPGDVDLIKTEIRDIFRSVEAFNEVVADAMQVLFVMAQKNKDYGTIKPPRQERSGWQARLPSTNPERKPRDKAEDWEVVAGKTSTANLVATPRAVRVFLSSTFSDTVLEWRFFLQDVVSYLKRCARNRGLDLDVSDMRFGDKEEESLTHDVRMAELKLCRKESAGVFYLLLLGDKYGPRPVPSRIPKAELESLLRTMTSENNALVSTRYALDENQLDATEYVLLEQSETRSDAKKQFQLEQALRVAALQHWSAESGSALSDPMRCACVSV